MKTYFGRLKDEYLYSKIKKELANLDLKVIKYYPKFRLIKFETEIEIKIEDTPFFDSIEEERRDFKI